LGFKFSSENFIMFVRKLRTLIWPAAAFHVGPNGPEATLGRDMLHSA